MTKKKNKKQTVTYDGVAGITKKFVNEIAEEIDEAITEENINLITPSWMFKENNES